MDSRKLDIYDSFCTLCVKISHVVNVPVAVARIALREPPAGNRLEVRSNGTIRGKNAECPV